MSRLQMWLKSDTANSILSRLPATEAESLKDYFHGQLSPKQAASEFVQNFDLDLGFNRFFQSHLDQLAAIAYEAPDSRGQIKLVMLLKNGRFSKSEVDLRNETDLSQVLFEFGCSLAEDQDCLWCDVLAPIRGGGCIRPETNHLWINLNAFLARLASVDTCDIGVKRVEYLCDSFIQNNDVRQNASIFNTSVSAAAQYMIYSASKVFEFCEQQPTLLRNLGWKEWKAGFNEAQTNFLIDASGKKYAELAVAGMNEAEVRWNRRQMLRAGETPHEL